MSIRDVRFSFLRFFVHLYYSLRTNDNWFEVEHAAWKVYHDLTQPIRAVYYVFWRMWKYRSILWNDFDWDQAFLLEILELKFRYMMRYHRDHGHLMNNAEVAFECLEMSEICRRLNADEYAEDLYAAHDAKWGELESDHEPADEYGTDKLGKPLMWHLKMKRSGATTEDLEKQQSEEYRAIWPVEQARRQADKDRFAELFRTRLENWWD